MTGYTQSSIIAQLPGWQSLAKLSVCISAHTWACNPLSNGMLLEHGRYCSAEAPMPCKNGCPRAQCSRVFKTVVWLPAHFLPNFSSHCKPHDSSPRHQVLTPAQDSETARRRFAKYRLCEKALQQPAREFATVVAHPPQRIPSDAAIANIGHQASSGVHVRKSCSQDACHTTIRQSRMSLSPLRLASPCCNLY